MDIKSWNEISKDFSQGTLVLGNGASIAVSKNFLYHSLYEKAKNSGFLLPQDQELFQKFQTTDFEFILQKLADAIQVNSVYYHYCYSALYCTYPDYCRCHLCGRINPCLRFQKAYDRIQNALIKTVRAIHPQYEEVQQYFPSMMRFLCSFREIYSLNYDLLLYWARMHSDETRSKFKDYFGEGGILDSNPLNDYRWAGYNDTLISYPHGNLALLTNPEQKQHANRLNLLEEILRRWNSQRRYPLFISEGDSRQKEASIFRHDYTRRVFTEILPMSSPHPQTLTIFGWALSENDVHILKQLKKANFQQVAISVYGVDRDYCCHAKLQINKYLGEIKIHFFDSESANLLSYKRSLNLYNRTF